ncbi:MAG: phosphotransferase family protein [Acidimicrobiales bacterium]
MAGIELDPADLGRRLAGAGIEGIRPLTGGASGLTYAATMTTGHRRPVVIKVAPPGVAPVLNRDVLRQSRLLRALGPTPVPVPEVVWEDAGDPPEVPPLFVMSYVAGVSFEPLFDPDDGASEAEVAVVAQRMANAARTLAALHALEPDTLGLAGEPRVGMDQEIDRWVRLLQTVDPTLAPGWADVASALRAGVPPSPVDAVVHGDFRLGNLLAVGADIEAVVDWEIWSIGDPRVDLGWFLVNADPATYRRTTRYAGALPSAQELGGIYTEAVGRPAPDVAWFEALACFKSTATWALIVKHNRRRTAPEPAHEEMAAALPRLLERASTLLG